MRIQRHGEGSEWLTCNDPLDVNCFGGVSRRNGPLAGRSRSVYGVTARPGKTEVDTKFDSLVNCQLNSKLKRHVSTSDVKSVSDSVSDRA